MSSASSSGLLLDLGALPSLEEIEQEQRRRAYLRNRPRSDRLAGFIREGWHVLEPSTELAWNWHIDAIAEHLEAVTAGQIRNLLINVPPGTAKSLIVSVFWPAWEWVECPSQSGLFSSYGDDLVLRDAQKCRDLVESEWYQTTFAPSWRFHPHQNAKSFYRNTAGGFRFSHTVGGGGTGHRAGRIVNDDPLKASDAYSEPARKEVIRWWRETMHNRLADPKHGAKVIIMQRLHEEDLSGWILQNEKANWEHLCLPMEYVTARHCRTGIGWEDPRKKEGELLFPERFPKEVVEADKRILGSSGFAGQDQQLPMPAEGGMFKKHWWRFWRLPNQPDLPGFETRTVMLPTHFDEQLLSLDCAFKKLEDNSKVCGGVWARAGARKFLLGCEWDFMDFTETCAAFMRLVAKYPLAHAKLIEDKANGPAVITTFKAKVSGIIAVEPHGGKESRAAATSPQVEAGDIFLPLHWDKRDAYIDEHAAFPKGTRNDAVDMQSQALTRWIKKPFEYAGQPANLPQRRV